MTTPPPVLYMLNSQLVCLLEPVAFSTSQCLWDIYNINLLKGRCVNYTHNCMCLLALTRPNKGLLYDKTNYQTKLCFLKIDLDL